MAKFDPTFSSCISHTLRFFQGLQFKTMSASLSIALESKLQLMKLIRVLSNQHDNTSQFAQNVRQVFDQPSHIYEQLIYIWAIQKDLTDMEMRVKFEDFKIMLRELELEELLAIERKKAQDIQQEILLLNFELFDQFLVKLRGHKALISAGCGGDRMELTLWRDPRVPLVDIEIPAQIGTAPVEIKWVDCHVPAPMSWTLPIGEFKSDFGDSYGWLRLRTTSLALGLAKIMTIDSHKYEKKFDGTTLRISAKKMYNPGGFSNLVLCLSQFVVPVWIRNVEITCTYTDPLA